MTAATPPPPPHSAQPYHRSPPQRRRTWPWILLGGVLLLFIIGIAGGNEENFPPTTATTTLETQTPAASAPVTVPEDLVGKSAQVADDELRKLGIINISYTSQDAGSTLAPLLENWTVTRVVPESGTAVSITDPVVITVRKKVGSAAPVAPPAKPEPEPEPVPEPEPERPAVPAPPPADSSPDASTSGSPYYSNCAAARAAGAAPLYSGDPGYRAGLDRDSDGVACE